MHNAAYHDSRLHIEDIPVEELADRFGTPLYVYSQAHLESQFQALARAMRDVDPLICYSVKANSNAAILGTFLAAGAGLDIVSGGELFRARRAGADPQRIVFAGVGKTVPEIQAALAENILFFTVESEPELDRISRCAVEAGSTARVAIRVNPDVDPQTHKYISTGKGENKFGLDLQRAESAYQAAGRLPGIEVVGMHLHIGSQLLSPTPFVEALTKVEPLCARLQSQFPSFRYLDIGGGIGIQYREDQQEMAFDDYAGAVIPLLRRIGLSVVMEPGRCLAGNAGYLLCRVQYVKTNPLKTFVVVDAAMTDLIRPALYQAYHAILPARQTDQTVRGDLVGPVCESGDFIAQDRHLPSVAEGDILAIRSAGAYGFAMACQYNSRPRAAEVMVRGAKADLIRERETFEDLVRQERPLNA